MGAIGAITCEFERAMKGPIYISEIQSKALLVVQSTNFTNLRLMKNQAHSNVPTAVLLPSEPRGRRPAAVNSTQFR